MREFMEGSHAIAEAVGRCRIQVIAAYPITPQTHISERLAELTASCEVNARFIMVESEHSAMACCIGASSTGARVFTATSSQGLALMHELLHWAAGERLPLVMANVNRALGPPWNIWSDQTDSLSQRDTGWMQFYCESSQEALDNIILGYKISEQVQLPSMVILDAYVVSHMNEPVDIPTQEEVDEFLPPRNAPFKLDPDDPMVIGLMTGSDHYMEFRYEIQKAMNEAIEVTRKEFGLFEEQFGRRYELVETYMADDADTVLVATGAVAGTCRRAIDRLRSEGKKIGMARPKMFRPFPHADIERTLGGRKTVVVVDRNLSPGAGGVFAQEIKASLSGLPKRPLVCGAIAGLGGREISEADLYDLGLKALSGGLEERGITWINVRPQ